MRERARTDLPSGRTEAGTTRSPEGERAMPDAEVEADA